MVRWFLFYFSSHVFISIGDKTPYQILCLLLIWPSCAPNQHQEKNVVLRENLREYTPVPLSSVGRTSAQSVRGLGFKSQWGPSDFFSHVPCSKLSTWFWKKDLKILRLFKCDRLHCNKRHIHSNAISNIWSLPHLPPSSPCPFTPSPPSPKLFRPLVVFPGASFVSCL